jgi:hypothetical protein
MASELEKVQAELEDARARLHAIFLHLPKLRGTVSSDLLMPIWAAVTLGYPDPPSEREMERAKQLQRMMYYTDGKRREVRVSDLAQAYLRGIKDGTPDA